MYKHRLRRGGRWLFPKVRQGTDLSKVVQHIALELQTMAGMDSGFGRSCKTREPNIFTVIFSYQEEAGR
jgi:cyanophycin synthetase